MVLATLSVTVELNLMEAEVNSTAKKLQETIDRLRSDFQQHRQVRRSAAKRSSFGGCSRQAGWLAAVGMQAHPRLSLPFVHSLECDASRATAGSMRGRAVIAGPDD